MGMQGRSTENARGATGRASLPGLVRANPVPLYLPIALTATWQYAMVKVWNHFCATPAAYLYMGEGAACLLLVAALAALGKRASGKPQLLLPSRWRLFSAWCRSAWWCSGPFRAPTSS